MTKPRVKRINIFVEGRPEQKLSIQTSASPYTDFHAYLLGQSGLSSSPQAEIGTTQYPGYGMHYGDVTMPDREVIMDLGPHDGLLLEDITRFLEGFMVTRKKIVLELVTDSYSFTSTGYIITYGRNAFVAEGNHVSVTIRLGDPIFRSTSYHLTSLRFVESYEPGYYDKAEFYEFKNDPVNDGYLYSTDPYIQVYHPTRRFGLGETGDRNVFTYLSIGYYEDKTTPMRGITDPRETRSPYNGILRTPSQGALLSFRRPDGVTSRTINATVEVEPDENRNYEFEFDINNGRQDRIPVAVIYPMAMGLPDDRGLVGDIHSYRILMGV